MTPDERQLLSGLFDRTRNASSQPRDREAEAFISDAVRQQPFSPYLLAQTVIVQEQALRAANDKLQELENKVRSLEGGQGGNAAQEGGFLGGIGRSIFGGGGNDSAGRPPANVGPQGGGFGQGGAGGGGFGGAPQGGPWGQGGQAQGGGGGFLKGALGMAAGVAGGALLGNAVSGLFHGGNNPFGIGSGMPGLGGGGYPGGGGETIVNNYYEGEPGGGGGGYENAADYGDDSGSGDGGGFDSDDGYNV